MSPIILTIFAVISAAINIRAEYLGPDLHIYIFKPMTMIFIIIMAVTTPAPSNSRYKRAVIGGLVFCIIGDILLMLPQDLFIPGLVSFLIGHILYIYAFWNSGKTMARFWMLALYPLYGVVIYLVLAPGLGAMQIPVIAYILVILTMVWRANIQWNSTGQRWAVIAFIGAILFVISDSILALNKFGEPFTAARALSLGTYFPAQWLISYSIRGRD